MMGRHLVVVLLLTSGALVSSAHAAKVTGTVRFDPNTPAGADSEGRVLVYTPKPLEPGSSHSHFDSSARPNLLMEPNISGDLKIGEIDLAKQVMRDMGWTLGGFNSSIEYSDSPGTGFNDPALGTLRRNALEFAVDVWSFILGSSVTVNVEARFLSLRCSEDSGTLASAGPQFVFMDFSGGAQGTWYAGALAESLSGENLSLDDDSNADAADLRITFNSDIDNECLGDGVTFYYGLDDNAPAAGISFATVALHEMGHGLGFAGLVDLATGEFFRGSPDIYSTLTYDTKKELHWHEMTAAQRRQSATRAGKVSLDGRRTNRRARRLLSGSDVLMISSPKKLVGAYPLGSAEFGPPLDEIGLTGDLALVSDGSSTPSFGCQPIVNANEVAGKIAVVDRGECFFVEKVKNAQDAGAIAVIIVHNEPGPPPGLGGSDETIVIPSGRIGKKDGKKIKRRLRK